jgi:D-threo-aldose 1-dehydrogenase
MMDKARRVAAVCARHSVDLRAAALQFVLAHPAIVSVIPGARSIVEVEENVALIERPIPAGLWADLKEAGLLDPAAPTPGSAL